MGTSTRMVAYTSDRKAGMALLERLARVLEETENQLSTWKSDSILSRLNRYPAGQRLPLDAENCRLFNDLFKWYEKTEHRFDPALGTLIKVWGIQSRPRRPTDSEIQSALKLSGLRHVKLLTERCEVYREAAVEMDAGAFGKGEALDRALRVPLDRRISGWFIDLGGQIAVSGQTPKGWVVFLAHPTHRDLPLVEIPLDEGSIATSGGSERDQEAGSQHIGHILDPLTGRPAKFSGAVTVWHESALIADVLSTTLYVLGLEQGLGWAEERNIAACFLVPKEEGLYVQPSSAFRRRFGVIPQLKPESSP
ncbi:MAG: FAD:protein FMN transferase [Acidobacteria bacterium]|nr:FAD:protein FMN transferase [Acidobacteriota bacterium]